MSYVCTVRLPMSLSYRFRFATLIRLRMQGPVTGALSIKESRTENGPAQLSQYVLREDPLPDGDGRRFRLRKKGTDEHYYVLLDTGPVPYHQCECRGFEAGGSCKHIVALRELLHAGRLEPEVPNE